MKKGMVICLCVALFSGLLMGAGCSAEGFEGRNDIRYVMIYNPDIWEESNTDQLGNDWNLKLSTGSFASQIDTSMSSRAGMPDVPEIVPFNQTPFLGLPEGTELSQDAVRAGEFRPVYEKGDQRNFYIGASNRREAAMRCLYVGENCYVWVQGDSISEQQAERYGKIFDQKIYQQDIDTFGTARFTDGGGKVHMLFYCFDEASMGGFFSRSDLYAEKETGKTQAERELTIILNKMNVDHAIINVNASFCTPEYEEIVFSTLGHEFQHLICFTDFFLSYYNSLGRSAGFPDVWLNEAMSGYIEEKLFPGIQEKNGRYKRFAQSHLIRQGQSLYHFATETVSRERFDIGVYGSVFLFAEYLEKNAGQEIFHRIHDYYRLGIMTDMSTAAALFYSLPSEFVMRINGRYTFPENIKFASIEQEWMSKLALDFYLSMLHYDENDPDAFEKIQVNALLYDNLNPADIEGGGRIVFATRNGSFEIPADADPGLVYVGLNADLEPVTGICSK